MSKKLAIAMFGQKRLSREGGVEIVVKELCTRMAQNGCDVTCYNRAGHHVSGAEYDDAGKTEYEGIRQKSVPTIERRGARDIIGSTKKTYDNKRVLTAWVVLQMFCLLKNCKKREILGVICRRLLEALF